MCVAVQTKGTQHFSLSAKFLDYFITMNINPQEFIPVILSTDDSIFENDLSKSKLPVTSTHFCLA